VKQLVAASLALGSLAVPSLAADSKTSIRASAGIASPASGDFKDAFGTGPNLSLSIGRDIGTHLAVLGEVEYSKFSIDNDAVQDALDALGNEGAFFTQLGGRLTIEGGDTSFLSGSVALKAAVLGNAGTFSPYVIAAGGVSRRSTGEATITATLLGFTDSETIEGDSETVAAVSFGGGLDFKVADTIGLFVEGRYQIAFTEEESTKYTTARAGLSLRL
jgi:hypothetical protein